MRERINKPRVFLSHARKDVDFIETLENDLRKCQIDTWRDQIEIQDGQPWLEAIFEDGIPTCDSILAYYTKNALNSQMVAKEVDSAILSRFKDSKIAFLPYVDSDSIRTELRVDIQTLHCRVWNAENYLDLLPSVVAQIWRSHMERSITNTVALERSARFEAELELEKLRNTIIESAFLPREEIEFQHIYDKLKTPLIASCQITDSEHEIIGSLTIAYSYIRSVNDDVNNGQSYYQSLLDDVLSVFKLKEVMLNKEGKNLGELTPQISILPVLIKFGLVYEYGKNPFTHYRYSDKLYRFLYWLEFNGKLETAPSPQISIDLVQN